jgi:hypothetical protein
MKRSAHRLLKVNVRTVHYCGAGSSVGIATGHVLRSEDRIPVRAIFLAHVHTGLGAHPASCTKVTGFFPG